MYSRVKGVKSLSRSEARNCMENVGKKTLCYLIICLSTVAEVCLRLSLHPCRPALVSLSGNVPKSDVLREPLPTAVI
jgi:hypothetical protein